MAEGGGEPGMALAMEDKAAAAKVSGMTEAMEDEVATKLQAGYRLTGFSGSCSRVCEGCWF